MEENKLAQLESSYQNGDQAIASKRREAEEIALKRAQIAIDLAVRPKTLEPVLLLTITRLLFPM